MQLMIMKRPWKLWLYKVFKGIRESKTRGLTTFYFNDRKIKIYKNIVEGNITKTMNLEEK